MSSQAINATEHQGQALANSEAPLQYATNSVTFEQLVGNPELRRNFREQIGLQIVKDGFITSEGSYVVVSQGTLTTFQSNWQKHFPAENAGSFKFMQPGNIADSNVDGFRHYDENTVFLGTYDARSPVLDKVIACFRNIDLRPISLHDSCESPRLSAPQKFANAFGFWPGYQPRVLSLTMGMTDRKAELAKNRAVISLVYMNPLLDPSWEVGVCQFVDSYATNLTDNISRLWPNLERTIQYSQLGKPERIVYRSSSS